MRNWTHYKTSDLISARILEIGDGYRAKNSEMGKTGIPFVRAGDVDGRVSTLSVDLLDDANLCKVGRKISMPGDVVMTTKGTIGRLAYVRPGDHCFIYSPQLCYWRSLDEDQIHGRWLFYAMRSPEMERQISWSAGQTDMAPYISLTDQRTAFSLTVPPVAEQREIAAILGALDDKIEVNRKASATLEEMARALYRSWFVDFDPVWAKLEGRQPAHMDAATAALFPDSFDNDGLPRGWHFSPMGAVSGQLKQSVKPMDAPNAAFWHYSLPAFDAGASPILENGAAIKSNKLFVPNDAILFSRLNPSTPRVWWARSDIASATPAASTEFYVAIASCLEDTPWLYCLLSSPEFLEQACSRVTGTSNSHQRVPPSALSEIEVIVPKQSVKVAFAGMTSSWFEKIHAM